MFLDCCSSSSPSTTVGTDSLLPLKVGAAAEQVHETIAQQSTTSQQHTAQDSVGIDRLPDDIVREIMLFMFPREIVQVRLVCSHWANVVESSDLWKIMSGQLFRVKQNESRDYESTVPYTTSLICSTPYFPSTYSMRRKKASESSGLASSCYKVKFLNRVQWMSKSICDSAFGAGNYHISKSIPGAVVIGPFDFGDIVTPFASKLIFDGILYKSPGCVIRDAPYFLARMGWFRPDATNESRQVLALMYLRDILLPYDRYPNFVSISKQHGNCSITFFVSVMLTPLHMDSICGALSLQEELLGPSAGRQRNNLKALPRYQWPLQVWLTKDPTNAHNSGLPFSEYVIINVYAEFHYQTARVEFVPCDTISERRR